jgi:hypothetical protein
VKAPVAGTRLARLAAVRVPVLEKSGEVRLPAEIGAALTPDGVANTLAAFFVREGAVDVARVGDEATFRVPFQWWNDRWLQPNRGFGSADAGAVSIEADAHGLVLRYRVRNRRMAMGGLTMAGMVGLVATLVATVELGPDRGFAAGLLAFAGTCVVGMASCWLNLAIRIPAVFHDGIAEIARAIAARSAPAPRGAPSAVAPQIPPHAP